MNIIHILKTDCSNGHNQRKSRFNEQKTLASTDTTDCNKAPGKD